MELIKRFEREVIKQFEHDQMGLFVLRPSLPKEAVCYIFEKHNQKQQELTQFNLLTSSIWLNCGRRECQKKGSIQILFSHQIEPHTLWTDDFESFFEYRTAALLHSMTEAMGKESTAQSISVKPSKIRILSIN